MTIALRKGFWRMRNGHTAEVSQQLKLPYGDKYHLVWKGRCVQCGSSVTWNLDGTYAAVPSEHPYDILEKISKTPLTP